MFRQSLLCRHGGTKIVPVDSMSLSLPWVRGWWTSSTSQDLFSMNVWFSLWLERSYCDDDLAQWSLSDKDKVGSILFGLRVSATALFNGGRAPQCSTNISSQGFLSSLLATKSESTPPKPCIENKQRRTCTLCVGWHSSLVQSNPLRLNSFRSEDHAHWPLGTPFNQILYKSTKKPGLTPDPTNHFTERGPAPCVPSHWRRPRRWRRFPPGEPKGPQDVEPMGVRSKVVDSNYPWYCGAQESRYKVQSIPSKWI